MSRAHQYHRPNAPDLLVGDPDSDIELDLQELGPHGGAEDKKLFSALHGGKEHREAEEESPIPLQNLRRGGFRVSGRRTKRFGTSSDGIDSGERLGIEQNSEVEREDSSENYNVGDGTPLLNEDVQAHPQSNSLGLLGSHIHMPRFFSRRSGYTNIHGSGGETEEPQKSATPRSINIGQHPPPRFPPNAVSNAKYTPWSFLPRTLYNEFSYFINMYFLLVSLSQVIPDLRIGVLWSYIVPLALVLALTLGKEAYDDIARRRRDAEANKEPYTVLRLRDNSKDPRRRKGSRARALKSQQAAKRNGAAGHPRLDAIAEEEENVGQDGVLYANIEVDEIGIRSRDLKVGDVVKLGKGQRVPADLVILQSYTSESLTSTVVSTKIKATNRTQRLSSNEDAREENPEASTLGANDLVEASGASPSVSEGSGIGETFVRTDQLDGETDWKLRLALPLTQTLDPRDFTRLTIVAGKPAKAVNEFVGKIELSPRVSSSLDHSQTQSSTVLTAPLTIDNTAWANTVLASSTTVLAVVVYTGMQTRQALSTSSSRSKVGLLELEINNLTKILCILTLALSALLVGIRYYYVMPDQKWYISVTRFLILFSTIIPLSLRVNLDLAKSVYAWFIEHDRAMPGAVVRTSTIPEDLGRIEYLLSDKTGTLTQNGTSSPASSLW